MAIRSIAQLKAWFKRGKYPAESQFADWIDSFFHKEEDRIPISSVENLSGQLNGKYPASDGEELEKRHEQLSKDFTGHEADAVIKFKNIHENLEELEAEDVKIWADNAELHKTDVSLQSSLTNAHNDIGVIRDMMKGGATLAQAKDALVALGANYKDLYAVAGTLKTFLEANDTADATINTWTEIERFLQGITDSQSLTAMLNALESKITADYSEALEAATEKTASELEKKLNKSDIINDLVTGGASKALSAQQGVELSKQIAGVNIVFLPQDMSKLTSNSTSSEILSLFGGMEKAIEKFKEIMVKQNKGNMIATTLRSYGEGGQSTMLIDSINVTLLETSLYSLDLSFIESLMESSYRGEFSIVQMTININTKTSQANCSKGLERLISETLIADNLVTTWPEFVLSANQGKILNDTKADKPVELGKFVKVDHESGSSGFYHLDAPATGKLLLSIEYVISIYYVQTVVLDLATLRTDRDIAVMSYDNGDGQFGYFSLRKDDSGILLEVVGIAALTDSNSFLL